MKFDSIKRTLNGLLVALTIFMASSSVATAFVADTTSLNGSLTGLWNNADQPGWGTAITHQYGMIFATFYTYDNAGNPTWYVASACPVSGSGCTGPLYTVTGGTNPIDAWNAPNKVVTQVGTMTFTFTDANTGTMSYSINGSNGTKTITKSVFASLPAGGGTGGANGLLNGSFTGLWNNADQPGWGAAVTHQYGMIFATFYTYDNAGSPTWYVASACPVSGSGCTGPLYTVTGGTNPIDAWNAPNKVVTQVGTMTFTFTDANTGTMSYSINGSNGAKTITKSVFASPPTGGNTGGGTSGPYGSLTVTGSSSESGTYLPNSSIPAIVGNNEQTFVDWASSTGLWSDLVLTINSTGTVVIFGLASVLSQSDTYICSSGQYASYAASQGAPLSDCTGITIDYNTRSVTFSNVKVQTPKQGPVITLNGKLLY